MKIACYIATLVFVIFASLQINDGTQYDNHDFWFWILIYLATALLSFWQARRHVARWAFAAMAGFAFGGALFRMQDKVGNFDFSMVFRATAIPSHMNASIQGPNEVGGLLVVAFWTAFLAWRGTRMSVGPQLA